MNAFIAVLFLSAFAQVTSLYRGPYLAKQVGENVCSVRPFGVTFIEGGIKRSAKADFDYNEMVKAIQLAQKQKMKRALHVVKTVPEVSIVAGIAPEIESFDLYRDSSALKVRLGQDAADLIELVNRACKGLKVPKK